MPRIADAWWGVAFLLWQMTGLCRAFAGTEKAPSYYYWSNHVFYTKMALRALVLVLEIWPMITLIRWRRAAAQQSLGPVDALAPSGRRLARISDVQTLLVVAIVGAAVDMARGHGARP